MEIAKAKRNEIKRLEKVQNTLWEQMIKTYFKPMMFKCYVKTLNNIQECYKQPDQDLEKCISQRSTEYKDQERYFQQILKCYYNNIEQCTAGCKFSVSMELEECYIECFDNLGKIVEKMHKEFALNDTLAN